MYFFGQCQFFNVKVKHSRKCLNLTLKNWLSVVKLTKQNEFYPNWWRSSPLSEARSRDATDAMIIGGCAPLLKRFRTVIKSGIRLYVDWFLQNSLISSTFSWVDLGLFFWERRHVFRPKLVVYNIDSTRTLWELEIIWLKLLYDKKSVNGQNFK